MGLHKHVEYSSVIQVDRPQCGGRTEREIIAMLKATEGSTRFTMILNEHNFHIEWSDWDEIVKAAAELRAEALKE